MELYPLKVFLTVANEKSFSRAAEKLLRTQPAVSLAIQKLESDLQEKLIDRSGKDLMLTDAGRIVLDYARRFENLEGELENALAELRDNSAGRLIVGANESTTLYLLEHIEQYRRLYPKVKVQVRRSLSSKIPAQLIDGDLELGVISYDPEDDRLVSLVIFTDHLAFVVSPQHRFASRGEVSITELGMETFIAHNVLSPYRACGAARVPASQSAAEHGCRDADGGDDPQAGAAQRRRGFSPAHVCAAGSEAGSVAGSERDGDACGAEDTVGVSGEAGAESCGEGVSRTRQRRVARAHDSHWHFSFSSERPCFLYRRPQKMWPARQKN